MFAGQYIATSNDSPAMTGIAPLYMDESTTFERATPPSVRNPGTSVPISIACQLIYTTYAAAQSASISELLSTSMLDCTASQSLAGVEVLSCLAMSMSPTSQTLPK